MQGCEYSLNETCNGIDMTVLLPVKYIVEETMVCGGGKGGRCVGM